MAGGDGSGDSSSVIKGGGKDLSLREGQNRKGDIEAQKKSYNLQAAEAALAKADAERLKGLKARIEAVIESNPVLKQYKKQLLLDITTEGLRIQMVDELNRPMFASAKADLQPYTKEILHEIGKALNDVPNKISLSGHTDSAPYGLGEKGYSNWELSADRANASRRELVYGGMDETKVLRVVGLSSSVLFDKDDPLNPINRRISIIVMNKKAEESASQDGGSVEVTSQADSGAEVSANPGK